MDLIVLARFWPAFGAVHHEKNSLVVVTRYRRDPETLLSNTKPCILPSKSAPTQVSMLPLKMSQPPKASHHQIHSFKRSKYATSS
jgi:hypothetical protein